MPEVKIEDIFLRDANDWSDWFRTFKTRANTTNIWKYVDPDQNGPVLEEPVLPVDRNTTEFTTMVTNQLSLHKLLLSEYQSKITPYRELNAWVQSTVDRSWYQLCVDTDGDLRKTIRTLREKVSLSDSMERERIRDKYRQALKVKSKTIDPENWTRNLQVAYRDAEKHGIPEIEGYSGKIDFLNAAAHLLPAWSDSTMDWIQKSQHGLGPKESDITLDKLLTLFLAQVRFLKQSGQHSRSNHAFATLNGKDENGNTPADTSSKTPSCPCGIKHNHSPEDCWAVQKALGLELPDGKAVGEKRVKTAKDAFEKGQFSKLKKKLLHNNNNDSNKEGSGQWPPPMVKAILQMRSSDSVFSVASHPLRDSTCYDPCASTDVVNSKELLVPDSIVPATNDDVILVGDTCVAVQCRGKRVMKHIMHGPDGKNTRDLVLEDVAFVPNFHTNIIAANLLYKKGYWFCHLDKTIRYGPSLTNNVVVMDIKIMFDLLVAEYKPSCSYSLPSSDAGSCVLSAIKPINRRFRRSNKDPLPPRSDSADLWHLRAGHLGPEALEKLGQSTRGVRIRGVPTVKCEACAVSKATQVISRRESEHQSKQPFWRVTLDLFDLPHAINGHRYAMPVTDEFSGRIWVFTMAHKHDSFDTVVDFEARVKRQYGLYICKIRLDNERSLINLPNQSPSDFQTWAASQGVDLELPPSHTKEPTGGAERSGGIIGSKARTMITSANLPQDLWPEVWGAAAYLHDRSPRQGHGWKSPLEVFERWFCGHFRWWQPLNNHMTTRDLKPSWSGIYAYGSKAYPLDAAFKAGKHKRHFKVNPRAHIGYLVGYRASNLYRIWVPALREVITARDVRFDEAAFFDPEEEIKDPIPVAEYRPMAEVLAVPDTSSVQELDLDVGDFETTEESAAPYVESKQVPIPAHSQADNLTGYNGLPVVASPTSYTSESQNSGVEATNAGAEKHTLPATPVGLPTPEPESTPLPDSPTVDPEQWTGEVASPTHDEDDAQVRDTIVVNTGPPDEESLPRPEETAMDPIFLPAGSGNDYSSSSNAHSGTDPGESAPTVGAGPAEGHQRRHRRRRVEIYGSEPTRRSTRHKPSSASWLLELVQEVHIPLHAVFAAAMHGEHRPHRDQLVKVPKYYRDLHNHPYGEQFKEACRVELRNLIKKRTWAMIRKEAAEIDNTQLLPLKWVFTYKFDEDGFLLKCKARICVRGDLQDEGLDDTYAATLAAKSFRVAMSIAARFNLEVKQFDVTNAFLNSDIKKDQGRVFCKLPDGYEEIMGQLKGSTHGFVVELDKALYGLRSSPLLWYDEFTSQLEAAGLNKSKEEPCIFTNKCILVLFYVDDILVFYRQEQQSEATELINRLKSKYEMRDEGDVKWFLGIRVIRDRTRRKVWLCQDAYCEKITVKFGLLRAEPRFPTIPLPTKSLNRHTGQASRESIHLFQEKVGSILYAAVTVRVDIAFAASQLSKHLQNPAPEHHAAADQVILYLYVTRFLAIEYNGVFTDIFVIASDASFADDPDTRHSSQGYVMSLFGGPVTWKAGKQDTVTTSTTEAELLGVERTTKESFALSRLMADIGLDLGEPLKVWCDNQQTIRLIVNENQRISTRLRHVDIQNMWLKQEFRKGRFEIGYLPTADMPADGLTKALPRQKFEHFRSLLNLADVQHKIGDFR